MASTSEVQKIDAEIDALNEVVASVTKRIDELAKKKEALDLPEEPPAKSSLVVFVKFHTAPSTYEFLLKHVPGKGYYTTGSLEENKFFPSWAAVLEYFNKDDVQWRTEFFAIDRVLFRPGYGKRVSRSH